MEPSKPVPRAPQPNASLRVEALSQALRLYGQRHGNTNSTDSVVEDAEKFYAFLAPGESRES